MVKQKSRKSCVRGNNKNNSSSEYSITNKRSRLDYRGNSQSHRKRKGSKKERNSERRSSSSSSSCCSKDAHSKKRRYASAKKRRRTKPTGVERTRNTNNRNITMDVSENESFDSILSHISHLKEDESEESATEVGLFKDIVQGGATTGVTAITDLNGIKFLGKKDSSGPPLEITFKTALVMHVKEAKRGAGSTMKETSSCMSRDRSVCQHSTGYLHTPHTSCSLSPIRVKSSQNFTNLNLQRESFKSVRTNPSCVSRHDLHPELKVLLPPTNIQDSCKSLMNPKIKLKNCNMGDKLSTDSFTMYDDRYAPCMDESRCSQLHQFKHVQGMINANARMLHSTSTNRFLAPESILKDGGDE
ncbi:hypothetical protein J6590_031538 [Homalodisca vitripennis]|nr:hypothetical protein J6590_031538 [Homalodisca vitripennis]